MAAPDIVQSQLEAAQALGLLAAVLLGGAVALPALVRFHRVPKKDAPPWLIGGTALLLAVSGTFVLSGLSYERRLYVDDRGARVVRATVFGENAEGEIAKADVRGVVQRRWSSVGHRNVPVHGRRLVIEGARPVDIELASDDVTTGRAIAARLGAPFRIE